MANTHQVHGDSALHLFGAKDAKTVWVISIRGDIRQAYDCDKESCEMVDRLVASAELQELKEALVESPQNRSCLTLRPPKSPSSRRTHSASKSRYLRGNL
jgi:hypothetical protein